MSDVDVDLPAPRRRRIGPLVAIPVLVVVLALVGVLATSDTGGDAEVSTPLLNRQAPAVVGETIDGEAFDLADAQGEFVLVNFFATWCVPCIREHPDLVSFDERQGAAGIASVVSVVYDSRPEQVREFFADNGGDWPVVVDPDGLIALSYGVAGVPESYLIAPDGTVVAKLVGGVTASGLDRLLAQVRGEDS